MNAEKLIKDAEEMIENCGMTCKGCKSTKLCDETEFGNTVPTMTLTEVLEAYKNRSLEK